MISTFINIPSGTNLLDYLKYLDQLELFYLDIPLKERLDRM